MSLRPVPLREFPTLVRANISSGTSGTFRSRMRSAAGARPAEDDTLSPTARCANTRANFPELLEKVACAEDSRAANQRPRLPSELRFSAITVPRALISILDLREYRQGKVTISSAC